MLNPADRITPVSSPQRQIPIDLLTPRGSENASVRFTSTDIDSDFRHPAQTARVMTSSHHHLQPRYVLESKPVRYEPRSSTF